MILREGQRFDRYTIEALLGEGGMGRVYRAYDTRLRRRVALKVLRFAEREDGKDAVTGALHEARAAAAITHPSATQVFDADEIDGVAFIAMELVPGISLRALIGDRTVPLSTRLRWLVDVAGALEAAHHVGVVHRDVKPENLLVREDGLMKVLDFGVARRTPAAAGPTGEMATPDPLRASLVGTPAYMAPEQIRNEPIDGRADQFGWGVVAYELCTGRLPWSTARDFVGFLAAVISEEPEPPSRRAPEIPPAVDAVLLRALRKAPDDRFPSMAAAAAALVPFATPSIALLSMGRASQPDLSAPPSSPPASPRPSSPHPASIGTDATMNVSLADAPALPPPPPHALTLASGPASLPAPIAPAFREPRFDAPVDLDAHLGLLPAGATCKGMFFLDLLRLGATAAPIGEILATAGIPDRRYVSFRDYPAADNMHLAVAVALAVYPGFPVGEGLRRIGQMALDVVLGSHVGRSIFGVLGRDVEAILLNGPRAFKLLLSFGEMTAEKVGHGQFLFRARRLPVFIETYQVGAIEGVLRHCGVRGTVRVWVEDVANGEIELEIW